LIYLNTMTTGVVTTAMASTCAQTNISGTDRRAGVAIVQKANAASHWLPGQPVSSCAVTISSFTCQCPLNTSVFTGSNSA
jgi:hypothetical protein